MTPTESGCNRKKSMLSEVELFVNSLHTNSYKSPLRLDLFSCIKMLVGYTSVVSVQTFCTEDWGSPVCEGPYRGSPVE